MLEPAFHSLIIFLDLKYLLVASTLVRPFMCNYLVSPAYHLPYVSSSSSSTSSSSYSSILQ